MAFPWFPLEIYLHILALLPLSALSDVGAIALARCLTTNSLLRQAASTPALWEPHYRIRYVKSVPQKEACRREALHRDWRRLYAARRVLDRRALQLLDAIVSARETRVRSAHAKDLLALGYDVWDALTLEANLPLPVLLQTHQDVQLAAGRPLSNLTRKYWAQELLGMMARSFAIDLWGAAPPATMTFEEGLVGLSAFWGVPPVEIMEQFDALTVRCKLYLQNERVPFEAHRPGYDIPTLGTAICAFMRSEGFDSAEGDSQFHSLLGHFPHAFLNGHKKTLPISLVCVFVAIARRLGLNASPVGTPLRVIAHVSSPDPDVSDTYFDVYTSSKQAIMSVTEDIPQLLMAAGVPPSAMTRWIAPSSAGPMLLRAARNIYSSLQMDQAAQGTYREQINGYYAANCAAVIVAHDVRLAEGICHSNVDIHPLDISVLLKDKIAPLLRSPAKVQMLKVCNEVISGYEQKEERRACQKADSKGRVDPAPVKYFVGQIFRHIRYSYTGCIFGWTRTCEASEDWIKEMRIDELPNGRNQPFYSIHDKDGPSRLVAEENICAEERLLESDFSEFIQSNPLVGRFFKDAEFVPVDGEHGRGRFIMNDESKGVYAEDDEYGERWVRAGL